jgi:tetratricopeptide (TPR) repeat protein
VTYLEESRELHRELERPLHVAHLWTHLGTTYRNWGKYKAAREAYEEAQQQYEAVERQVDVAHVLWELGLLERQQEHFEQSMSLLEEKFQSAFQLQSYHEMANTRRHQAITQIRAGEFDEAEELALTALALAEEHDLLETIAWCLETLAEVYGEWGQFEKSREYGERALKAYAVLGEQDIYKADVKIKLGKTELKSGNVKAALEHLNAALQTYLDYNQFVDIARTKRELARVYAEQSNYQEARMLLEESLNAFQQFGIEHEIKKTQKIIDTSFLRKNKVTL